MRDFYFKYRKILKAEADDPFVLTSLQFWCFARDFQILAPLSGMV